MPRMIKIAPAPVFEDGREYVSKYPGQRHWHQIDYDGNQIDREPEGITTRNVRVLRKGYGMIKVRASRRARAHMRRR